MRLTILILAAAAAAFVPNRAVADPPPVSPSLRGAVAARIDPVYAVVLFADGHRSMLPLADLKPADRGFLDRLAAGHPLGHGKSKVVVQAEVRPVKKTIERATTQGTLETVQLCPPAVFRDQMGNTCELYAIIHCLDIAGFYVQLPEVYKIVNMVEASNPKNPWADPRYKRSLTLFTVSYAPRSAIHLPNPAMDPFEWARQELRKGHPILAAFPESIWEALPPAFVAAHEWDGGKEGHAIVVNGFTWDKATRKGTFHIINSWRDLSEFDLTVENAKGLLVMQWSLSAKNEVEPVSAKEVVLKVFLIKSVGTVNLYDVETNLDSHRVAARSEAEAVRLVESPDSN